MLTFAAQDTTTSMITRILHQLALNPDVQTRLRKEVTAARSKHGDLDYDALVALPYLDAVCRETLRVHPAGTLINRVARQDIVLPLAWPIKSADGKTEITKIPLKKNTELIISIINANLSKGIWGEDAEQWKPERWLQPLTDSVINAHLPGVYSSMMTFLGGRRACIGYRFAETEIKLVLSVLLEAFIFFPGSKEICWNMSTFQTPTIKDSDDTTPQLPLRVSLIEH